MINQMRRITAATSNKGPIVVFLILLIPLFSPRSWAESIYVDGSLLQSSCTTYSPFSRSCGDGTYTGYRTIDAAASVAAAGDTVYIRAGTYREQVTIDNSGNASSGYITFRNFDGESVTIDGDNGRIPTTGSGGLIHLYGRNYIKIVGIKVTGSNMYGIKSSGSCNNIIIEGCEVSYSDEGGIVFEKNGSAHATNVTIDRCDVHHNNRRSGDSWHEAITLEGVDIFTVKNNRVHDNENKEGIDAKYGARNGEIYGNECYNNYDPGIYIDGASYINVYKNKVYNQTGPETGHGIMLGSEALSTINCSNINIYNNLIYNNAFAGINLYSEAAFFIENCSIINNTIVNNPGGGILFMSTNRHTGNVFVNNLLWNNGIDFRSFVGASVYNNQIIAYNLFRSGSGTETYGSNYIKTSDVKFVNESQNDFHIQATSSAKDAGDATAAPPDDFDGTIRPSGSGYDIGAYEYFEGEQILPSPPENLRIVED